MLSFNIRDIELTHHSEIKIDKIDWGLDNKICLRPNQFYNFKLLNGPIITAPILDITLCIRYKFSATLPYSINDIKEYRICFNVFYKNIIKAVSINASPNDGSIGGWLMLFFEKPYWDEIKEISEI